MPQKELEQNHDIEEEAEMQQMETEGAKILSLLLPYFPPRNPGSKRIKDPKDVRFGTFRPLLPEKFPFEGEVLGKFLELKMEDWDFNDTSKYPQFKPSKYLLQIYYPDSRVTRSEPH